MGIELFSQRNNQWALTGFELDLWSFSLNNIYIYSHVTRTRSIKYYNVKAKGLSRNLNLFEAISLRTFLFLQSFHCKSDAFFIHRMFLNQLWGNQYLFFFSLLLLLTTLMNYIFFINQFRIVLVSLGCSTATVVHGGN